MKRKRKESCPSPILDDSPKRTKVQAQRKFAQNSGMHSPIITPIRDLEAADLLPHTSVMREPVELLPMKRPNTEDFLTFLCFRGTPILPSNLQFFNAASIVADGQVHEIKSESPKNGPIDISKCAGSSSDKPFIAFGVRKRADPIVISRQMERKRRHALAIQALRRRYQEQKMAKIRALTISKLSEKTTNKTLVKTNTIQKTETVTKKTNTLQKTNTLEKTKVVATKHVKVTTQTLKTKVKPKMCLRSFRGKFVQKELPFRARRAIQERATGQQRADIVRTSKNSNKLNSDKLQVKNPPVMTVGVKETSKTSSNARVTRSGSVTSVVRNPGPSSTIVKRPQVKRRILLPSTTVTVVKPKLRSTTTKKTVISRRKAQQRMRVSVTRQTAKSGEAEEPPPKEETKKNEKEVKKDVQKNFSPENAKKASPQDSAKKTQDISKRITRRDSELAIKNVPEKVTDQDDVKKEVTRSLELKREVKIAETSAKKEIKKNVNLKREFRLKSTNKDVKKNVDVKKTSNTVLESDKEGQKVKRDVKTVEMTMKKVVTRRSDDAKHETNAAEEKLREKVKKGSNKPSRANTTEDKEPEPKKSPRVANKATGGAEESHSTAENTRKVTRGSSTSQKKNAADSDQTNVEPKATEKKESKTSTEKKPQNKEPAVKNPQKEESSGADTLKKEYKEQSPLEEKPAVKKVPKEELAPKKSSKEPGTKGVVKATSLAKDVSKKSPQRTPDEALAPKRTSKESVAKCTPKAEVEMQKMREEPVGNISKKITGNSSSKAASAPKKSSDEDETSKKATHEVVAQSVVAEGSPAHLLPEEAAKEAAKECKLKEKEASNLNIEEPLTKLGTKEDCAAPHLLDEVQSNTRTRDSPAKSTLEDNSLAKPLPDPEVAPQKADKSTTKSISIKDASTQESPSKDLKSVVATKEPVAKSDETKILPEKATADHVARSATKDEDVVAAGMPSEEESQSKKGPSRDSTKKQAVKEQIPVKKASKDESPAKKSSKQESPAKKTSKEESSRRKPTPKREEPEQAVQKASPRPSRKTKEAAAIYMEILSHKLVNDSTIDDDNVSIDSFPELPNVKKTEQREIELKAQAKTSKDEEIDERKSKKIGKGKKDAEKVEPVTAEVDMSGDSGAPIKKALENDNKTPVKLKTPPMETPKKNSGKDSPEKPARSSQGKRKSNPVTVISDSDSDNEVLQAKIRKCEAQKNSQQEHPEKGLTKKLPSEKQENPSSQKTLEEVPARRQTRRSTYVMKESASDSSDESFHVDVRVPRKKKVTRSQNRAAFSMLEKNVDIILEAARVLESEEVFEVAMEEDEEEEKKEEEQVKGVLKEDKSAKGCEDNVKLPEKAKNIKKKDSLQKDVKKESIQDNLSDSDESTTSDINLKTLQVRQRNKKLSKTKSAKSSASFSDSDEEPLAKLTLKNTTAVEADEPKKKPVKHKLVVRKTADKVLAQSPIMEPKAKRECTKRPSNYLPMLSSSDEDDESYFHGFNTTKEDLNRPKAFVQSLAPSLDLLSKDIGRKGKVNMSNEQIEQWLKDSALAGSSVAKENDAMLKFGEKIPAETSAVESSESRDAQDVKLSKSDEPAKLKANEMVQPCSSKTVISEEKAKSEVKSSLVDRKWIFKKAKTEMQPNKNAFSPENECSVYAFGEDNEEVISTPFRRPTRRPSSTATSRSEDELSKNDDNSKQGQFRKPGLLPSDSEDSRCFNIPQNPTKLPKTTKLESMVPPSTSFHSKRPSGKSSLERFPEPFDDFKYKVPSSPSASSGSSAKLYKKGTAKQKGKAWEVISSVYVSDFPKPTDLPKLVEAPVFHPTEQEFQDPLEYIERIRHKAEQFGICKIVPPSTFKPECKVSDDMRFTAYNQYVHKMLHRWGPNFKEFMVIKKYLATQNIPLKSPPLIGGMEIDLPRLYQTVQSLGGLKEVIEKKKWPKVSDHMKIPKLAQDRVTKLDDIYCKYLLPYDTLSPAEREKLFDDVETYWAKKESKNLQLKSEPKAEPKQEESSELDDYESDDNEAEECTVKSKNMALNAFYRIARNTMSMYFKVAEPTAQEVEQEFWRYVTQKQNHICVHSASIDCGNWGYGFSVSKNSPFAKHAWNLKVMSNNSGSVLRSLGPVMGVTIPTLHVGMVFSACCWYRDPHGLPWVEYLHTGGNKIWYGIPSSSCDVFQAAMRKLVPNYCRDKELWLPSDTAMVPPGFLMEHNVSLSRTVQEPGQFLVVFPKVFTSSVSTGYVVSESVYFAPLHWLRTARGLFNDLKSSCEPSMFSLDKLLISIANDSRTSVEVLRVIVPFIEELYIIERDNRVRLRNFGKIEEEKITNSEISHKKKKMQSVEDVECEICRMNLFISMVVDTQDELVYCLEHAIDLVAKNSKMVERFKLRYALDVDELASIPGKINSLIETKLQKKVPSKYAGLPTMLK